MTEWERRYSYMELEMKHTNTNPESMLAGAILFGTAFVLVIKFVMWLL